ncbi:MAG: YkgJ family cysteine cluster protein [Bryobacteraceae bacterium]
MSGLGRVRAADRMLVRIVDQAMQEAERRSGEWLACRPGCTQCCLGTFPITQLDALRLRDGLKQLRETDPQRAERVLARAREAAERYRGRFPGDAETGVFTGSEEEQEAFHDSTGDDPCPALDPATGLCDLYAWRPITCRTFGPAVRAGGEALGHCELCYEGATAEQIEACVVDFDPDGVEALALEELERASGERGRTLVAFALERAGRER